jgi:CO dehydrogenase maturation factor
MYKGFTIALSGKGGVGKTGLAALIIRHLCKAGSLLAIDADPDSNLPQALGVQVRKTVGEVRESVVEARVTNPVMANKGEMLRQELFALIEEAPDFDVVVMGRPEGEGCYCPVNYIIREVLDNTGGSYDFTVIDCEAGLEHLSRRTTRDVDLMLVVTDATTNGLLTAKRVQEMSRELAINVGNLMVVANKVTPEAKPLLEKVAQEKGLEISAYIPYDPTIADLDLRGKPIVELPSDSPASVAVTALCDRILKLPQRMPV